MLSAEPSTDPPLRSVSQNLIQSVAMATASESTLDCGGSLDASANVRRRSASCSFAFSQVFFCLFCFFQVPVAGWRNEFVPGNTPNPRRTAIAKRFKKKNKLGHHSPRRTQRDYMHDHFSNWAEGQKRVFFSQNHEIQITKWFKWVAVTVGGSNLY